VCCIRSPSGVPDGAPAENEFGAPLSCQKATCGNRFEYSEYHVLQYNDQNFALANMSVSDCVSLSPKKGGGAAPSVSATELH